ncbi:reverse transcriptase domain-containing protein [Streptomyces halstedii]|uniref:reverse transcriptase domain-containing protein n=1 Tax=Streptomyces halstedii TaxID=1944 RepID=UPI003354A6D3
MNTDELDSALFGAERRVLKIQTKLHCWARGDPHRRFDDLFNLVADPAFLLVAWDRVRGNKGARTAGVDERTARSIEAGQGVVDFLDALRSQVKGRSFCPLPVRERMIPKSGGKLRRLGNATIADRVVQASLKLVLEPIFEADFHPCSYGFRPNRRAHDAVAEVRYFASRSYEWVVEGDITACFDEISHPALMDRVRERIGDKRVPALVKAFLKAGILGKDRMLRENRAGTPQGSILSPLLSNVALTVLDEHIAQGPGGPASSQTQRAKRRRHRLPNYRLVRYADDWCLMVSGTKDDAEALRDRPQHVHRRRAHAAPDRARHHPVLLPGPRLVSGTPERLSLPVLATLCDILDYTPTDLITTTAQNLPVRRAAGEEAPINLAARRPTRVRLTPEA